MNWLDRTRQQVAAWVAPKSASAFDAASTGRRFKGRVAPRIGINTAIFQDGELLRARARDLVRQNPWASSGLDSFVANAVGTGIKPRSKHPDPGVRDLLNREFEAWTAYADAHGNSDFYGLQSLAFRSMLEAGECLVRRRPRYRDEYRVPLQLQLLEAEHLPITRNSLGTGNDIRMGIEYDALDRRVAYHLEKGHPDETAFGGKYELSRVDARDIAHIFQPIQPGQQRGITRFAQSLIRLAQLDKYDDATLLKAQMSAMLVYFLTEPDPENPVMVPGQDEGDDDDELKVEPGQVVKLRPGENVTVAPTSDIGAQYDPFMRQQLRAIAAGLGVTYSMLTGDTSQSTYASDRSQLLEFRRKCEHLQWHVLVFKLCRPVWSWWLDAAAMSGVISASDLQRNRALYEMTEWRTPKWDWVDPLKDVQAEIKAIRAGLTSREAAVAERGYDVEEIDRAQQADQQRADRMGLEYDTDGRRPEKGAAADLMPSAQPGQAADQPQLVQ